jgi:hypothetical protein
MLAWFQRGYFAQATYVPFSPTELVREKRLNQVPGHGWSHGPAAHTDDIHVVVLHSLAGGEVVVNQPGADTRDLVGTHRSANPATADSDAATHFSRGHRAGERDYHIGIIVSRIEVLGAEIDYLMPRCAKLDEQLLL